MRLPQSTTKALAGAAQEPPSGGSVPSKRSEPNSTIEVDIAPVSSKAQIDVAWLKERLNAAAREVSVSLGLAVHCLNVRVVGDAEMTRLHRQHLGIDSTTDVLTFDLSGDGSPAIQADLAICADEAARRANDFGHSIERELLLYALHGLLHCAGFDDHSQAEAEKMHAEEDRVLRAIGVGSVYQPETALPQSKIQSPQSKVDGGSR